ncbi:AAEL003929-PA [Aedes aegypti]|uniref:AAEL003929-PA n=1 Tax=Aedes aegypti TaxID=7159 RepID=Q0IFW9_AEDAE|nr:AAEL003929-PA [Aedes aegypti]
MFSTHDQLKRRTPKDGIDRREFITLLVDEYYETSNLESQQQVTANLANFAYDPINWNHLKQAKAHDLFVEILNGSVDPALLVHAAAGICNLCLDTQVAEYLRLGGTLKRIRELIERYQTKSELVGHLLTTLVYVDREPLDVDFRRILLRIWQRSNWRTMRVLQLRRWFSSSFSTGQVFTVSRVFRREDLDKFAEFTGDSNPIHRRDQQSFVNGALLNATTAGIIGSNFPGYVVTSQEFRFPNRCRVDEEVQFRVQVEGLRKIVTVSYECSQGEQTVFEGTAKLFAVKGGS